VHLPNTAHQVGLHRAFRADSTLTSSAAQLVLPVAPTRSYLFVQNISGNIMYLDHGPIRISVTMSGGVVTACTVINGGFNYTLPPLIEFQGGFLPYVANSSFSGIGLHGTPSPTGLSQQGDSAAPTYNRPAKARCILSGGAVTSIVVDDGGFGYVNAPFALIRNNDFDPFGCALPSSTSGIVLAANGGSYSLNGTFCHTDQIALIGTTNAAFCVEYGI
jgi:hypothetical protein